ncbi:MAG: DUF4300 family protein [Turicibacter sp.]|nr:DUF4300 family protein [Turicibacter sp.]
MKRKLIISLLAFLLLISLYLVKKDTYTYSNLTDQESQQLLETLIPKTIAQNDLTLFWNTIHDYNNMMNKNQLIKTKISTSKIQYPTKKLMNTWYENNLPYYDLDSKLLSFRLFNHYLKLQSDSIFKVDSFDLDIIETNPYASLSSDQFKLFTALYAPIEVSDTDPQQMANEIKTTWQNRTLSFHQPEQLSLINLFMYDKSHKQVYVEQSGLLFYTATDLYYLEKYAPIYPYQLIKFKTKQEFIHYLKKYLPIKQDLIILENDELLDLH